MVRRGDMMSVEDVSEILAIDLLGVIPDDEQVVIATNQGEPIVAAIVFPDAHIPTSAEES